MLTYSTEFTEVSRTDSAVLLLSGGIDSATSLYIARKKGYEITAITFLYRKIAKSEVRAAKNIARIAGIREHRLIRIPDIAEVSEIKDGAFIGYPPTYIPMRNSIFYSIAASVAEEKGASLIIGGHINGDSLNFKDATQSFFNALQKAFWEGSEILSQRKTRIYRPLERLRKYEVVKKASMLGVPLELTWSCHRDGREHCWECDGCLARMEAFSTAGIPDPLNKKS